MNPLTLVPLLGDLLDRVLPDPKIASDAKLKVMEMAQAGDLQKLSSETQLAQGQIDTNKVEAASESLWKSGWRPFVGWVCGSGLAYQLLLRPVLGWVALNLWGWSEPPSLEMDTLMTLLFGILGLGAYRTFEKVRSK